MLFGYHICLSHINIYNTSEYLMIGTTSSEKKMVLHIPFVNFGNLKLHFKERVVSKSAPHGMGPRPLEGIHSDEVVSSCMTNASPDFGGLFSVPILRKTVK